MLDWMLKAEENLKLSKAGYTWWQGLWNMKQKVNFKIHSCA